MKSSALWGAGLCVALLLTASPALAKEIGASDDARIKVVGGELVSDAENPGAVYMGSNERPFFCSAGLIGKRWVLTARHCIDPKVTETPSFVAIGSVHIGSGQKVGVKRMLPAPKGDQALIELAEDAQGKILPYAAYQVAIGEKVTIYGWGMTGPDQPTQQLKRGDMRVKEYVDSPIYSGGSLGDAGIDGVMEGITGVPYFGDSGGSLLHNGIIVADVSGGDHQGTDPKASNFNTLTGQNAAWIEKTTGIKGVQK